LWGELSTIIQGRSAPIFASLIAGPPPFTGWDVADRYSCGTAITKQCAQRHLDKAAQIIGLLEQALREGILP
jgi:hypothetical protein